MSQITQYNWGFMFFGGVSIKWRVPLRFLVVGKLIMYISTRNWAAGQLDNSL
jgi:hypothetical protein